MTVKYQDPYKDDPYGKLKGGKSDSYFKVTFSEAKIHKTDEAYIIAAHVTAYEGVVRAFKPDQMLMPGLCAIPIYGQEYSLRKKNEKGEWIDDKHQPSTFEKALYDSIKEDESILVGADTVLSGSITHLPNGMMSTLTPAQASDMVTKNITLVTASSTGKLPEYKPPTGRTFTKGGGKSWGLSPDQRIDFLKKQLATDVCHSEFTEANTLAELTDRMFKEHPNDEAFITIYFDMLIASIK